MKKSLLILGSTIVLGLGLSSCKKDPVTPVKPPVKKPIEKPAEKPEVKINGSMLNTFYIPKGMNMFKEREKEVTKAMNDAGVPSIKLQNPEAAKLYYAFQPTEEKLKSGETLFYLVVYNREKDWIEALSSGPEGLMDEAKNKDNVLSVIKKHLGSQDATYTMVKSRDENNQEIEIPAIMGTNPEKEVMFQLTWTTQEDKKTKKNYTSFYLVMLKLQQGEKMEMKTFHRPQLSL